MPPPVTEAQLAKQCEARVGRSLVGKWTLDRLIGTGAMAAVYRATHKIGRIDAIKILHPHAAATPDLRRRFELEAEAANHFSHEGAVKVHDSDVTEDGCPFLVMEYLEGETMGERATRLGGLPQAELLGFMDELLDVLAAAHAASVIHRDIKLENLFITRQGRLKVLDFGIARVRSSQAITVAGARLGTAAYMSPEQVRGQKELDGRADLFSVGATMFRIIAKRRIHEADSEADLYIKMGTTPAPKISTVVEGLDPLVAMVVDRALEFRAEQRYPNATTMQADIRAVRAGKPPPYAVEQFRLAAQSAGARGAPTLAEQTPAAPPSMRAPTPGMAATIAAPLAGPGPASARALASQATVAIPPGLTPLPGVASAATIAIPKPAPSQPGLSGTVAITPAMMAASRMAPGAHDAAPISRGPASLGPSSLGPSSLAPSSLGPSSLGPSSLGPSSPGPRSPGAGAFSPAPPSVGAARGGAPLSGPASGVPSSLSPATFPHSSGRPPPPSVAQPGAAAAPRYQPAVPVAVIAPAAPARTGSGKLVGLAGVAAVLVAGTVGAFWYFTRSAPQAGPAATAAAAAQQASAAPSVSASASARPSASASGTAR